MEFQGRSILSDQRKGQIAQRSELLFCHDLLCEITLAADPDCVHVVHETMRPYRIFGSSSVDDTVLSYKVVITDPRPTLIQVPLVYILNGAVRVRSVVQHDGVCDLSWREVSEFETNVHNHRPSPAFCDYDLTLTWAGLFPIDCAPKSLSHETDGNEGSVILDERSGVHLKRLVADGVGF